MHDPKTGIHGLISIIYNFSVSC